MSSSDRARRVYEAATIGPAAWAEVRSRPVALRVHSVFASAVNLEVNGSGMLIAVTGPAGSVHPHAIALACPVEFSSWPIAGATAILRSDAVTFDDLSIVIDLAHAQPRPHRSIPFIVERVPKALEARLAAIQAMKGCALRVEALSGDGTVNGAREVLRDAASALGYACKSESSADGQTGLSVLHSASALIGLGAGLTPSGDDFLCGFIAAARARRSQSVLRGLTDAFEANVRSTSDVSASLLRLATRNYWPEPLIDLADAIAADAQPEAMAALEALCAIGHTSGADLATGFLSGLHALTCNSTFLALSRSGRRLANESGFSPKERSYS